MIRVQEHRISWLDLKTRRGEGAFQIGRLNQLPQTFMRQIQTDTLGVEHRQRHRIDRLSPVLARHMVDGVDVRTGMLAQFQPVHGG